MPHVHHAQVTHHSGGVCTVEGHPGSHVATDNTHADAAGAHHCRGRSWATCGHQTSVSARTASLRASVGVAVVDRAHQLLTDVRAAGHPRCIGAFLLGDWGWIAFFALGSIGTTVLTILGTGAAVLAYFETRDRVEGDDILRRVQVARGIRA